MDHQAAPVARVTRAGRTESVHFGHVAVCAADGTVVEFHGDAESRVYLRSSAKPFQAMAVLDSGAADRFAWTDEQIAVVCASHFAEPDHLATVRAILHSASLTEADLGCGPHPPIDAAARDALIRAGQEPTRIHNNCSGKHAGMLAACVAKGWQTKGYYEPAHPLQQALAELMMNWSGREGDPISIGIDGCGVPTFYVSVREIATMYARLASAPESSSALRISRAMRAHPRMVAGSAHFSTRISTALGTRVLIKGGAEGVVGVAIPELGLGIAAKVSDGSSRALPVILCHLLDRWLPEAKDLLPADDRVVPIKNTRGEPVGTIESLIS